MESTIMVAIDPASAATPALAFATEWCLTTTQKLLMVSSFDPPQAELQPDFHHELLAGVHREMEGRLADLTRRHPVEHRSLIVEGDASEVIVDTARREDPALVVIGARGGGGFDELGLGGVAHHVAHHLRRPMVVASGPGGPMHDGTIVVGIDGSPSSRSALAWAASTAHDLGAHLHVVFASDPLADAYPSGDGATNVSDVAFRHEDDVRAEIDSVDLADVDVSVSLVDQHPVAALSTIARDENAAMIVVGTRGSGGFHGLVLGRVPAQLLHHAKRPVALIHHPE